MFCIYYIQDFSFGGVSMFELVQKLRLQIGDTDIEDPNITDEELEHILNNAAKEYSRVKGYIKSVEIPYDKTEDVYDSPIDSYRIKKVLLKGQNKLLNFEDNLNQFILNELIDVDLETLKITYVKYFKPEEVDEREMDIYFMLCEALCYKLMASKTAELIKFSTGEKMVDESLISEKYLDLYKATFKDFKKRLTRAYGKKADYVKENLDYLLPKTSGEQP